MKRFSKYAKIGIDFDETLIDHEYSADLWDFIAKNPYNQEFYIVTFRSGGLELRIWDDLAIRGSRLEPRHFAGVLTCPHEIWRDFHYGDAATTTPKLITSLAALDHPYLEWKGMVCADNEIEILVDDMPDMVLGGCRKHGVEYVHPDDIIDLD